MTLPRKQLVSPDITPYYHCVSRCVRRSFLCGEDHYSGQSYEHRRQWVEDRILTLAQIYCIDICAYAVMSNHYHLVVHINQRKAELLSENDVIERWETEHQLPAIIQRYRSHPLSAAEKQACQTLIHTWRKRLYSLSWLMKELNFEIAKQANQEDGCTGHFWEGRFKSQALLDEKALLAAMAYTDLNPVRAGLSPTPEMARHTSLRKRIDALEDHQPTPVGLSPFVGHIIGDGQTPQPEGIPFRLMDYLELVDWVGRQVRANKPGVIDSYQPAILTRLSLSQADCLRLCTTLGKKQCLWIGSPDKLNHVKRTLNKQRIHGISI